MLTVMTSTKLGVIITIYKHVFFLCNNTHRNEGELVFVFESGIIFVCKIIIAEKN